MLETLSALGRRHDVQRSAADRRHLAKLLLVALAPGQREYAGMHASLCQARDRRQHTGVVATLELPGIGLAAVRCGTDLFQVGNALFGTAGKLGVAVRGTDGDQP